MEEFEFEPISEHESSRFSVKYTPDTNLQPAERAARARQFIEEISRDMTPAEREIALNIITGTPVMYVTTKEVSRACRFLEEFSKCIEGVSFDQWNCIQGFTRKVCEGDDPVSLLIQLREAPENTVVVLENFHFYLGNPDVIQALRLAKDYCKENGIRLILVSARKAVPPELEKEVVFLDYPLPTKEELRELLRAYCETNRFEVEDEEKVLEAGKGLTLDEFERALAKSVILHGKIVPKTVRDAKAQLIKDNSALSFSTFDGGFDTLVGLERLKWFTLKAVSSGLGRGVLVLGVPGVGKSHFAKCLGNETNRPTIMLDFGLLMSSYVGETEQRTKEALDIVEAMAPCILMIDEIEKGLAGAMRGASAGDSGVAQRQGGIFLKWLQDHESDVYVVATCNDISKLPPEYLRAERWDAVFFVDLPDAAQRKQIFELYARTYGVGREQVDVDPVRLTEGWTGAEIKTLCRNARMMECPISEAAHYVTPICKTMGEEIESLRKWAAGRTIPANEEKRESRGRKRAVSTIL